MTEQHQVTSEEVKERLLLIEIGKEGYVCGALTKRLSETEFHTMYHDRDVDDAAKTLAEFYNC